MRRRVPFVLSLLPSLLLAACGGAEPPQTAAVVDSSGGEAASAGQAGATGASAGGQDATPGKTPGEFAMLWRVSRGDATVYLLGSIHVANPDFYPLAPSIEAAFDAASAVAFEINPGPEVQAEALALVKEMGLYPHGRNIWSEIGPETAKLLRAHIEKVGWPAEAVQTMRPWFLAVSLTMFAYAEAGLRADLGIDQHIYQRAVAADKEVRAIETPRDQLRALGGHPPDVQELMLRETLEGLLEGGDDIDLLGELWLAGDAEGLSQEIHESMGRPEYAGLYKALFADRNRVMADAVLRYLDAGGTTLVVVGTGHLVGEGSVVALLAEQLSVEQLRSGRGIDADIPESDDEGVESDPADEVDPASDDDLEADDAVEGEAGAALHRLPDTAATHPGVAA